ncbi:uncharacterized protein EDB91DRAFT_1230992 [Suillus paluster]|uniref:uncharacterized protein n=1 Tax=Suillus paluster TaxID=48578 RepID=UPI001B87719B|nr:uncharacterized protein EDB91DRAFT_1230992 [Suillus paluster]KAG1720577.1 hypothetical protein EDB91DRAFT_1230992 [Suillus paluster]
MANAAGATVAPKTPTHGVNAAPTLKSTPNAVGSAVISEHISTVGVQISDLCPWISWDVENFRQCGADAMLQELLDGCQDTSVPPIEKSKLLKDSLNAVVNLCNNEKIKEHVKAFAKCTTEPASYPHFVKAANAALLELHSLNVSGLTAPRNNDTDILFHHNDYPINRMHQDQKAQRKPDIVVVSCNTAKGLRKVEEVNNEKCKDDKAKGRRAKGRRAKSGKAKDAKGNGKDGRGKDVTAKDESSKKRRSLYMETAAQKPDGHFQWRDVHSTFEFKCKKGALTAPPKTYKVKECIAPKQQYLPKDTDPVEPTSLASGHAAAGSNQPSNQSRRGSGQVQSKQEKKRSSNHLPSNEPASKRAKSNNETGIEEKEPKKLPPNVQNGMYVAEMFAANIARQHVISCVVNNNIIYMWYFDRQDIIQCAGINFIQDLPRFLVLLLAMQRMSSERWGLNTQFKESCEIVVDGVDLKFDLTSDQCITHFGLRGRATTVFPEQGHCNDIPSHELVAKLYWPEEERESEAEILKKVYEIATSEPDVKGHVPEVVWSHKFEGTSTVKIRTALGLDNAQQGSRVLYIIMFKKLIPITKLSGDEFLTAWWQIVCCHYALWKKGVRHRDVSPSNLMVYKTSDGRYIGILNDYDLSSTQGSSKGNERTGTVPFMSINLLEPEAMKGKVEHLYRHNTESLIWVLVWVCLRYHEGELLTTGRPLDDWLKVDANGCAEKKSRFLLRSQKEHFPLMPTLSHQSNWDVALSCLRSFFLLDVRIVVLPDEKSVLETWFQTNLPSYLIDL